DRPLMRQTWAIGPMPACPSGPSVATATQSSPAPQSGWEVHGDAQRLSTQTLLGVAHLDGSHTPSHVCMPFTVRVKPPWQNGALLHPDDEDAETRAAKAERTRAAEALRSVICIEYAMCSSGRVVYLLTAPPGTGRIAHPLQHFRYGWHHEKRADL